MVRIYDVKNYEEQGEDQEETTDPEAQEIPQSTPEMDDEEMKNDSDADKNWEDIEDEMDSDSDDDEEEEKDQSQNNAITYSGEDINWAKNKTEMERRKRQEFFSDL